MLQNCETFLGICFINFYWQKQEKTKLVILLSNLVSQTLPTVGYFRDSQTWIKLECELCHAVENRASFPILKMSLRTCNGSQFF